MDQVHSKPLSSLGIKKMRVGKTLADLGKYRGLRFTRNTAGIRYIYRFRGPHTDKLTQITLGQKPDMSLAEVGPAGFLRSKLNSMRRR